MLLRRCVALTPRLSYSHHRRGLCMDNAIAVVLLLIVSFLVLGGGWFLIMRTELKIEQKMRDEFELKREEE